MLAGPTTLILSAPRGVLMTAKRLWIGIAIVAVVVALIVYFVVYGGDGGSGSGGGTGGY